MDMSMNSATMVESMATDALLAPPTASVRPYRDPHHYHDLALHKYLILHEQHESLRQHLDELRPPRQNSVPTPVSRSPITSPTGIMSHLPDGPDRCRREPSPPHNLPLPARKRSCPAGLVSGAGDEVAVEEAKLCDVNEGIKRALTELLNCETVRTDRAFRTWVQCRLMDTERELRSGRRRRSAPGP
jgi:hypothetical protein